MGETKLLQKESVLPPSFVTTNKQHDAAIRKLFFLRFQGQGNQTCLTKICTEQSAQGERCCRLLNVTENVLKLTSKSVVHFHQGHVCSTAI